MYIYLSKDGCASEVNAHGGQKIALESTEALVIYKGVINTHPPPSCSPPLVEGTELGIKPNSVFFKNSICSLTADLFSSPSILFFMTF